VIGALEAAPAEGDTSPWAGRRYRSFDGVLPPTSDVSFTARTADWIFGDGPVRPIDGPDGSISSEEDTAEAVWLECVAEALRNPTDEAFDQVAVCCACLADSGAPAFELVLSNSHMKASSALVAKLMDAGIRPDDIDKKHTVSLNFIDLLHIRGMTYTD
jgi:hypothetical protein